MKNINNNELYDLLIGGLEEEVQFSGRVYIMDHDNLLVDHIGETSLFKREDGQYELKFKEGNTRIVFRQRENTDVEHSTYEEISVPLSLNERTVLAISNPRNIKY